MTDIEVVNPATGEVLEHLDQQPPEALAATLAEINAREEALKRWRGPLENELRRRLKMRGRKLIVYGDWEVQVTGSRESVWDLDQLEAAMEQLIADGVAKPAELTGIVIRDPVVVRSKAGQLRDRLQGEARALVDACCTWKEKRGRLTVARSVNLLDAVPAEAAEETPPVDGQASRDGAVTEAATAPVGPSEPPDAPPLSPSTPAAPAPTHHLNPEELFA